MNDVQFITAKDFKEIPSANCCVIDVRTLGEHQECRLTQSHDLIPIDELNAPAYIAQKNLNNETPLYILCRSGKRAVTAATLFAESGYTNTHVIEGGILSCVQCGVDVEG